MARIVWLEKNQVRETDIPARGFVTVGKGSDNTINLNVPGVSRHHVRLAAGPHGCLLKDLQSVGGVVVNGDAVRTRFLKDGDIIRIGGQVLEFVEDAPGAGGSDSAVPGYRFETNVPAAPRPKPAAPAGRDDEDCADRRRAFLRFIAGPGKGRILALDRPLVPVGDPSRHYAAVSCRSNGLYLLNLGREFYPTLNGDPVHGTGAPLQDGDKVEVGEDVLEVRVFSQTVQ